MYNYINSVNFVLFLREEKYRRRIQNLNNSDNLRDFASVISSISPENFISEEELYEINYEVGYDD